MTSGTETTVGPIAGTGEEAATAANSGGGRGKKAIEQPRPRGAKKAGAKAGRKKAAAKKAAPKKARAASVPREFSKKAAIIDLLRRKNGATATEIAEVSGWQAHSIRGFISGMLMKRMGLTVDSVKNEGGGRTYRIKNK